MIKTVEDLEEIAEIIDTLNNLKHSLGMPVPPAIHVNAMKDIIPEVEAKLKEIYFKLGGENVWS